MKKIFLFVSALFFSASLMAADVICKNCYREIKKYTDKPYYSIQFSDANYNDYYFGFKDDSGPKVGQTYTLNEMIASETYVRINYENDAITELSFQRNYEGLQEKITASVTTQSGKQYNLTWAAANVPEQMGDDINLNTNFKCKFMDYGYYKIITPLVNDPNSYGPTIAFVGDLPAVGVEKTYTWKENTIYIMSANFTLPNDWTNRPFDAKYVIKGVEGGCEGTAEYSMTNGHKYIFNFYNTHPSVDETGITVNGRKYGFPIRLVTDVPAAE